MFGMYSIGFRVKLLEYCTKYLFPKKTHFTCTTKYIYKIILRKNQNIDNNNNNNNVILKNRNETNVSAACSASGDVNNRRSFGVWALWLHSPSRSHCIQQTEGMEIKQWANYTFLKIVICLFYTAVGVFIFIFCGAVLQLSDFDVNSPGLGNTCRKPWDCLFWGWQRTLTLRNQWDKSPKCQPPGSSEKTTWLSLQIF